jgi:hypothetical protein
MKKRFISNLILLLVGMGACKPTQERVVGLYRSKSREENGLMITLDTKHRYRFYAWKEEEFIGNKGYWQINRQTLVLTSDTVQYDLPQLVFRGTTEADSVKMQVCWSGDSNLEGAKRANPIAGATVKVKMQGRWLHLQADQMGYLKLANAKIDSVQVQAAGMQPLKQALGRKPIGPIVILIKKEHSDKIHFINEKW